MHRWHFQRLFRWLIPVFFFVVALCVVLVWQKSSGVGLTFLDDGVYADFAVARNVIEHQVYGLHPDQAAPGVRNVLWRFLLAAMMLVSGGARESAYILGAVFSLLTILLCLRWSHLLFPFPPFILYSAVLIILAPSFLMTAMDRPSLSMSTALLTAACLFHVEGLTDRRSPLPIGSAVLVGLLAMNHLEFVILWMVFFIHALVMSLFGRERSNGAAFVVTRALTGVFIIVLCLFPLIARNLSVLQVPWPQGVGAPFVMDRWLSDGPLEAIRSYFFSVGEGMVTAFSLLYDTPCLSGPFERILLWLGVLTVTSLAIWRPEERPFTLLLFLLLLMPLIYALIYPSLGWGAALPVYSSMTPLFVVAAAFGIFRVPFLVEGLYRKWKQGLPAAYGFNAWWMAMGSVLLLVCLIRSGFLFKERNQSLAGQLEARSAVSDAIGSGAIKGRWVVTDRPGWIAYQHRARVLDLTGEFSPQVLACLDSKGELDASELGEYLVDETPDSMVLWTPESEAISSLVPCEPVGYDSARPAPEWPKICAISRFGAF